MEHVLKQPEGSVETQPHHMSDPRMAATMARESPEGRPGDPELRGKGITGVLLAIAGMMVIGGLVIWFATSNWKLGLAVASFGVFAAMTSPAVWSAIARGKEREDADKRDAIVIHDHKVQGGVPADRAPDRT